MKKKIKTPTNKLLEMLSYKRKEGSVGQRLFNERFIQPLMGKPDNFNNYICEILPDGTKNQNLIYPKSKIAFMAHHDTVHRTDGRQKVIHDTFLGHAYVDGDECLGADCTTGVWLIIEMIRKKVPGVYVVHSGEECGGIGATGLVKSKPKWLSSIDIAISFDRYGTNSIITHQSGLRTCSESFASDLESILNLNLESDSTGTYTDSYEYMDVVSECTNLSVGYYNQHTKREHQDLRFAVRLLDSLVAADWSKLKAYRDPTVMEFDDWHSKPNPYKSFVSLYEQVWDEDIKDDLDSLDQNYTSMERVVEDFTYEITEILHTAGYDKRKLLKEILRISRYQ